MISIESLPLVKPPRPSAKGYWHEVEFKVHHASVKNGTNSSSVWLPWKKTV